MTSVHSHMCSIASSSSEPTRNWLTTETLDRKSQSKVNHLTSLMAFVMVVASSRDSKPQLKCNPNGKYGRNSCSGSTATHLKQLLQQQFLMDKDILLSNSKKSENYCSDHPLSTIFLRSPASTFQAPTSFLAPMALSIYTAESQQPSTPGTSINISPFSPMGSSTHQPSRTCHYTSTTSSLTPKSTIFILRESVSRLSEYTDANNKLFRLPILTF